MIVDISMSARANKFHHNSDFYIFGEFVIRTAVVFFHSVHPGPDSGRCILSAISDEIVFFHQESVGPNGPSGPRDVYLSLLITP